MGIDCCGVRYEIKIRIKCCLDILEPHSAQRPNLDENSPVLTDPVEMVPLY